MNQKMKKEKFLVLIFKEFNCYTHDHFDHYYRLNYQISNVTHFEIK